MAVYTVAQNVIFDNSGVNECKPTNSVQDMSKPINKNY